MRIFSINSPSNIPTNHFKNFRQKNQSLISETRKLFHHLKLKLLSLIKIFIFHLANLLIDHSIPLTRNCLNAHVRSTLHTSKCMKTFMKSSLFFILYQCSMCLNFSQCLCNHKRKLKHCEQAQKSVGVSRHKFCLLLMFIFFQRLFARLQLKQLN